MKIEDRDLLELAAKTVGFEFIDYHVPTQDRNSRLSTTWVGAWAEVKKPDAPLGNCRWNPLTDDGDALRLLAALPSLWGMKLMFGPSISMNVLWGVDTGISIVEHEAIQNEQTRTACRSAAIRRTIVRAAAEMGRQK